MRQLGSHEPFEPLEGRRILLIGEEPIEAGAMCEEPIEPTSVRRRNDGVHLDVIIDGDVVGA